MNFPTVTCKTLQSESQAKRNGSRRVVKYMAYLTTGRYYRRYGMSKIKMVVTNTEALMTD